jgi:hypothetical protein
MTHPNNPDDRILGKVIQVPEFPVNITWLVVLAVIGITAWFWKGSKDVRETLNFFVLAGALAGGVVSAFYLWAGVKTAILQRRQSADERRIEFALQFLARYNDPAMARLLRRWRQLSDEMDASAHGLVVLIQHDIPRRTIIADLLNFFEEMGYAAYSKAADLPTLQAVFKSVALDCYERTTPWIKNRRATNRHAWKNVEWLCDQWKDLD